MNGRRDTCLVALLLCIVFAASCRDGSTTGSSASMSPQVIGARRCPDAAKVVTDPELRAPGGATADLDGDGEEEKIFIARDDDAQAGCAEFLVAHGATKTAVATLAQPGLDTSAVGAVPTILTVAQVDGRPGLDVVVNLVAGASTQFAGVYSMAGGELERVRVKGDLPEADDLFPYGGSVGHIEASDCTPGGAVVVSQAVPDTTRRYDVTRRFLRFDGQAWRVDRTQRREMPLDNLSRLPEFATGPFAHCRTS